MTSAKQPPHWQLPPGVSRGLWDYVHSRQIAEDYDEYFAFNELFAFDEQVLARWLPYDGTSDAPLVADLGCGTGRALIPLARRGFRGLAIDLSQRMLDIVRQKAQLEQLSIQCLQANLVELDAVQDNSVDHAISLFSTLGMIQGGQHRQQALRHIRRILKPGGRFILHVHNYWYNLYDPGGPWWLLKNLLHSALSRSLERGDKFFPYRGLPSMYLHVFTRREILRALHRAGFRMVQVIPLDPRRHRALRWPWLLGSLRANGWMLICQ